MTGGGDGSACPTSMPKLTRQSMLINFTDALSFARARSINNIVDTPLLTVISIPHTLLSLITFITITFQRARVVSIFIHNDQNIAISISSRFIGALLCWRSLWYVCPLSIFLSISLSFYRTVSSQRFHDNENILTVFPTLLPYLIYIWIS